MNTLKASRGAPDAQARNRRTPVSFFVSLALHLVVVVLFVQFLISPDAFMLIFGHAKSAPLPVERIGFLRLPKAKGPAVVGQSGGNNRPVSKSPPVKLVAPTTIPTTIPPVTAAPSKPSAEEGSGPLVGTGGPARGIRPSYTDPRLWPAPGDIVAAPKTPTQRLDSVIADLIQPYNDSIAARAGQRQPGDWTIEKGGRKYGIDSKYIHLGKFSIPTAILGLLPINAQANPILNDRPSTLGSIHSEIMSQAQRGMNEADFRKAVKSIRERKEREKAAASAGSNGGDNKKRPADQPPAAPGPPSRD